MLACGRSCRSHDQSGRTRVSIFQPEQRLCRFPSALIFNIFSLRVRNQWVGGGQGEGAWSRWGAAGIPDGGQAWSLLPGWLMAWSVVWASTGGWWWRRGGRGCSAQWAASCKQRNTVSWRELAACRAVGGSMLDYVPQPLQRVVPPIRRGAGASPAFRPPRSDSRALASQRWAVGYAADAHPLILFPGLGPAPLIALPPVHPAQGAGQAPLGQPAGPLGLHHGE